MPDVLSGGRHYYFTGKVHSGGGFVGVNMSDYFKSNFFIQSILIFMGLPLLFWAFSGLPARSFLKETLSVISILAFCQMMGQFYWARTSRRAVKSLKMGKIVKYHKIIGYTFVAILLLHPFFLVIPRFSESGVAPFEALITILSTFNQGVLLGITAWGLMLILGITALFRNKLPIKYRTWRTLHGTLAILFMVLAAWHVIDLGRHSSQSMSALITLGTAGGVLLLLKTYIFQNTKAREV